MFEIIKLIVLSQTSKNNLEIHKSKGHQSIGFRDEDFLKLFTINGHDGHFGDAIQFMCILSFPCNHIVSYKIWFQMTQQFPRKTSLNYEI